MAAQGSDDTAPAAQRAPGPAQPSIKARALRLLAGREHSRAELERKLAPHEQAPGQLAQALVPCTAPISTVLMCATQTATR